MNFSIKLGNININLDINVNYLNLNLSLTHNLSLNLNLNLSDKFWEGVLASLTASYIWNQLGM